MMKETENNTVVSSAPKGQSEMQVLQDHPSSEEKPNRNLEGLSLESLFIKNPALLL